MADLTHDSRFREAVELFNQGEFFACHDALEEVWSETLDEDREFLQGLIHVAVCLFHFGEGNLGGARKMYDSACRYLSPYGARHAGLDLARLREDLRRCFAELLGVRTEYPTGVTLDDSLIPQLHLTDLN